MRKEINKKMVTNEDNLISLSDIQLFFQYLSAFVDLDVIHREYPKIEVIKVKVGDNTYAYELR